MFLHYGIKKKMKDEGHISCGTVIHSTLRPLNWLTAAGQEKLPLNGLTKKSATPGACFRSALTTDTCAPLSADLCSDFLVLEFALVGFIEVVRGISVCVGWWPRRASRFFPLKFPGTEIKSGLITGVNQLSGRRLKWITGIKIVTF
jgi:hypothetical protein